MGFQLIYDSYGPIGFHSEKKEYEPGENVYVSYIGMGTDISYVFRVNVDEFKVDYGDGSVATITFVMPDHDVELSCDTRNVMGNSGMAGPSLLSMTEAIMGLQVAKLDPGSYSSDIFHPKDRYAAAQEDGRPEWTCEKCGTKNKGKFCMECGSPRKVEQ